MTYPLPQFSSEIRQRARDAVVQAAKWLQVTQLAHAWPHWSGDTGRFIHVLDIRRPDARPLYSISWDTARTTQALLSAYKLTGDAAILETCTRAANFLLSLQIFDPEFQEYHGAFRSETPLSDFVSHRDTLECVQGLTNMHAVTKEKKYLDRAVLGADWLAAQYGRFPGEVSPAFVWLSSGKAIPSSEITRIAACAEAMVFSQLDAVLGQPKYQPYIGKRIDGIIATNLDADGGLRIRGGIDGARMHVCATGALKNCFTNDDGFGVALIAACRATNNPAYRAAVLRYGGFWAGCSELPANYASLPAVLNFLLDMYRFTGEKVYLDRSLQYLPRVLELQYHCPDNARHHGGFLGHESGSKREHDYFSGQPMDYLCLRTTMYALLALCKMAVQTEEQWNLAYSGFGW